MTIRLPPGVRDYLPVAAARRRGIVAALMAECERWGYRPIITPVYEYDDVLRRGLGETRGVRFVEPVSGEILSLRPDLTPQVARLVATRLHDEPGPLRLAYEGSVVRADPGARGQGELFQVGVELVDAPQPGGDLEVVALAEAALAAAGVGALVLDLGHAAVVRAALTDLELDEARAAALHTALQRKDAAGVAAALDGARLPAKRRRLLVALPSLYGGPEVIDRARALQPGRAAAAGLDELERLVAQLAALGPPSRISVDLGEVRGFQYYTGLRFALLADGAGGALSSGGRYDHLLGRYGRPARAAGFAVDVDRVAELLRARGVAAPALRGGLLVAGEPLCATQLAGRLRRAGQRALVELESPAPSDAALKLRAARHGLDRVLVAGAARLRWFDAAGAQRGSLAGAALVRLYSDGSAGTLDALLPTR